MREVDVAWDAIKKFAVVQLSNLKENVGGWGTSVLVVHGPGSRTR